MRGGRASVLLGVNTCGTEHQGLQDVRQGDDPLNARVLVHHHQTMDLVDGQTDGRTQTHTLIKRHTVAKKADNSNAPVKYSNDAHEG